MTAVAMGAVSCESCLAVDGSDLYWLDNRRLMRVPKDGGEPDVVLSDLHAPRGLLAMPSALFLIDEEAGARARVLRLTHQSLTSP